MYTVSCKASYSASKRPFLVSALTQICCSGNLLKIFFFFLQEHQMLSPPFTGVRWQIKDVFRKYIFWEKAQMIIFMLFGW